MSKIKNFTAFVFSGAAGFLIRVKGEVNCGKLTVEPKLTERVPPGFNPTILQLNVEPASDQEPGNFRPASFTKNLSSENQYKQVELFDSHGNSLQMLEVKHVLSEADAK